MAFCPAECWGDSKEKGGLEKRLSVVSFLLALVSDQVGEYKGDFAYVMLNTITFEGHSIKYEMNVST
jgi:hypothetical protein